MKIPSSYVRIPDREIVKHSIPAGYSLSGDGSSYIVYLRACPVANVRMENGLITFEVYDDMVSREFQRKLYELYPGFNPERILWGVFYRWQKNWGFGHIPNFTDRAEAIKSVEGFEVSNGAYLCSFKACDFGSGKFTSITSEKILSEFPKFICKVGEDEGPKEFSCSEFQNYWLNVANE